MLGVLGVTGVEERLLQPRRSRRRRRPRPDRAGSDALLVGRSPCWPSAPSRHPKAGARRDPGARRRERDHRGARLLACATSRAPTGTSRSSIDCGGRARRAAPATASPRASCGSRVRRHPRARSRRSMRARTTRASPHRLARGRPARISDIERSSRPRASRYPRRSRPVSPIPDRRVVGFTATSELAPATELETAGAARRTRHPDRRLLSGRARGAHAVDRAGRTLRSLRVGRGQRGAVRPGVRSARSVADGPALIVVQPRGCSRGGPPKSGVQTRNGVDTLTIPECGMMSGSSGAPEEGGWGAAPEAIALVGPLVIVGLHERLETAL